MKKYLFILTTLVIVGCSSEESSEVDISNLSSKESLESAKDEISDLKKEKQELLDDLEARKVVDRAKGALMDQYGLKEKDAYRYLQKKAMEERSPMKVVAESILQGEN